LQSITTTVYFYSLMFARLGKCRWNS
jgi:hypothetical protein